MLKDYYWCEWRVQGISKRERQSSLCVCLVSFVVRCGCAKIYDNFGVLCWFCVVVVVPGTIVGVEPGINQDKTDWYCWLLLSKKQPKLPFDGDNVSTISISSITTGRISCVTVDKEVGVRHSFIENNNYWNFLGKTSNYSSPYFASHRTQIHPWVSNPNKFSFQMAYSENHPPSPMLWQDFCWAWHPYLSWDGQLLLSNVWHVAPFLVRLPKQTQTMAHWIWWTIQPWTPLRKTLPAPCKITSMTIWNVISIHCHCHRKLQLRCRCMSA